MKNIIDFFTEERAEREANDPKKFCWYGIAALDDAFYGIRKNDLIVIGADSGSGKTEIGLMIARHNAIAGRKVALFNLEGGHRAAIRRLKWHDIRNEYYGNGWTENGFVDMDYRKWLNGELKGTILDKVETKVLEQWQEKYKDNFYAAEINRGFGIEQLQIELTDFHSMTPTMQGEKIIRMTSFNVDLIVIDHLQYFDLPDGEKEIIGLTKILKSVRDIVQFYDIPVILISHLVKKMKDRGLPDQADFYGTSNIPKMATAAITISPAFGLANLSAGIYPTYFRIVKSQIPNVKSNCGILINFDSYTGNYSKDYTLHSLDKFGMPSSGNAIEEQFLPHWAKKKPIKIEPKEVQTEIGWQE